MKWQKLLSLAQIIYIGLLYMMNLTVTRLFHGLIRAIVSGRRANAWNVGFKNSLRWLIYIMSVDKRKLSTSFRRRSTVGNLPPLFYWGSWLTNRETRISQVRFRFGWLRAFLERKKHQLWLGVGIRKRRKFTLIVSLAWLMILP